MNQLTRAKVQSILRKAGKTISRHESVYWTTGYDVIPGEEGVKVRHHITPHTSWARGMTDEKARDQALEEYQHILEAAGIAVWRVSEDLLCNYPAPCNHAHCALGHCFNQSECEFLHIPDCEACLIAIGEQEREQAQIHFKKNATESMGNKENLDATILLGQEHGRRAAGEDETNHAPMMPLGALYDRMVSPPPTITGKNRDRWIAAYVAASTLAYVEERRSPQKILEAACAWKRCLERRRQLSSHLGEMAMEKKFTLAVQLGVVRTTSEAANMLELHLRMRIIDSLFPLSEASYRLADLGIDPHWI